PRTYPSETGALRLPLEHAAQPVRLGAEHPQHHARAREQEPLDLGPRDHEAMEYALRDDVRRRRPLGEDGDLAEEVAPSEPRDLRAVPLDDRRDVEDHVEAAPGEALAENALP